MSVMNDRHAGSVTYFTVIHNVRTPAELDPGSVRCHSDTIATELRSTASLKGSGSGGTCRRERCRVIQWPLTSLMSRITQEPCKSREECSFAWSLSHDHAQRPCAKTYMVIVAWSSQRVFLFSRFIWIRMLPPPFRSWRLSITRKRDLQLVDLPLWLAFQSPGVQFPYKVLAYSFFVKGRNSQI